MLKIIIQLLNSVKYAFSLKNTAKYGKHIFVFKFVSQNKFESYIEYYRHNKRILKCKKSQTLVSNSHK